MLTRLSVAISREDPFWRACSSPRSARSPWRHGSVRLREPSSPPVCRRLMTFQMSPSLQMSPDHHLLTVTSHISHYQHHSFFNHTILPWRTHHGRAFRESDLSELRNLLVGGERRRKVCFPLLPTHPRPQLIRSVVGHIERRQRLQMPKSSQASR